MDYRADSIPRRGGIEMNHEPSKFVEYLENASERFILELENKRLRKALEEIVERYESLSDYPQIRYSGLDLIARKALAGEEKV